jgi:hypothetical protein
MDDLKKLSVERLRELARKHLGKGHSRLRTRAQLLEALKDALREPLERLREGADTLVTAARKKVRVVEFPPGRKGRVRPEHTASEPASPGGSPKTGRGHLAPGKETPPREQDRGSAGRSEPPAAGRGSSPKETATPARPSRTGASTRERVPPPAAGRSATPERVGTARGKSSEPAASAGKATAPVRAGTTPGAAKPSTGARETSVDGRTEPSTGDRAPSTAGPTEPPARRTSPGGAPKPPAGAPKPSTGERSAPTGTEPSAPRATRTGASEDDAPRETRTGPPPREPASAPTPRPAAPRVPAGAGRTTPPRSPATRRPETPERRAVKPGAPASTKDRVRPSFVEDAATVIPSGARASASAERATSARASSPSRNGAPASPARAAPDLPVPLPAPDVPVEQGFFDAPATPRRIRRAPEVAEPFEPEPFASPREVGTEAPLLLVRDPSTLFVFWDFRRELERGAALGLREPRLLLRLYRGEDLDRSIELPLSSRSVYVTGLLSGDAYTAEVLLLGRDGWTRPVGARSAARRLPPGRVSSRLEVRTLRLPWSEPLDAAPVTRAPATSRHEPLDSPRRVPLPTSPGARGAPDGPGPSGGSRSGRN